MEPVAIIGTGCRFPGAKDPQVFWQLLQTGVDAITEVPPDRWNLDEFYDSAGGHGKMNTRWGGFLEQVDQFDPQFFGIAPREATYIDPQQRLLLEVAWEALEDAGQAIEQLARTQTGVFVGISTSDYHQLFQGGYSAINAYMGTGNAFSIAANRLSYTFDFRGPSMAIDTACSSSLVAVHLACQSLRNGESDLALAGGVNLLLSPELTIVLSQAQMMSADGRCKTFDARANGYVRGEGCGVVVLKRLADALRDNDPILATIRGSAVNQDGRSNGLTAPNGPSQEALLRQAIANAGVTPDQINYVELHGTGTALGDPIEAEALGKVLSENRPGDRRCPVGSVKTNIGHLESAAGIAGLIKVALSLKHRQLPPSLHFQTPNPYISFEKLPLKVQQTLEAFPENDRLMVAGVSAFGFGGTNAHIILEEFPQALPELPPPRPETDRPETDRPETDQPPYLLPLSARHTEALRSIAQNYQKFLTATEADLHNICYTASLRRSHHEHRLALVAHSREEFAEYLEAFLNHETRPGLSQGSKQRNRRQKLVFVFSGQGGQWWAMGRQLQQEPVFREKLEQCDQLLRQYVDWSLMSELMADEAQSRIEETEVAQPALFALQVALSALWRSWGIEPHAVVGHSIGEVAAAHMAGVLSLEDAVRVVFHRSRLMQQATGQGKMAAVELSVVEAEKLLADYDGRLAIAAINGPTSLVLSGETAAIESVVRSLEQQQIFCRMLRVDYAFHSPQMQPFQAELVRSLQGIQPQSASIPIASTVTGGMGAAFDAEYWGRNIREPVCFADAIEALLKTKHTLFLELSPHPILAMNIAQCLRHHSQEGLILPSLRRQEPEKTVMLRSLGSLYSVGYPVVWQSLYELGQAVSLPLYPWQRSRYWLEEAGLRHSTQQAAPLSPPLDVLASEGAIDSAKPEVATLTPTQLLSVEGDDRQALLELYLSEALAKILGFSAANLDLQQPLYALGLDSLMAVEISRRIQADLEVTVPMDYFAGLNVAQFVTQVRLLVESASQANSSSLAQPVTQPVTQPLAQQIQATANPWLPYLKLAHLKPKPDRLRLFCLPYAGTGASMFGAWSRELPLEIEVCPIQLPGREERLGEEPLTRLPALVQALTALLKPYLEQPFAFFGYSLGALISFELVREMRRQGLPAPAHLFVSASRAPQVPDLDMPIHRQPEPQFLESLRRLNGTPEEVLQNPDLMKLFLPALRSDFALLETYFYTREEPLDCPITAFGGEQDSKVSQSDLAAWRDQTQDFTLTMFSGDHFFLQQHQKSLLQAIARSLVNTSKDIPYLSLK